ncbi:T9SS type A sorting domain-containing protein [Alkalitalea saponilacus]|uniref:Por secretion system C-terminal sorting domain-containing protein n=1 Tax=Alkalitalea saponilacus TaxID=889453 RepID=A0A1T5GUT3_9BACT|nr:T9SS type A sorting domain-containing protein [Alkalitalea saponilacus]ASB48183.1 hypothetical protein CDL62_02995 [Alkalitalea saponilacus]SKC12181.1 hypothetical protein SAMN03080601_01976 [Alkalitalea saponilacus]
MNRYAIFTAIAVFLSFSASSFFQSYCGNLSVNVSDHYTETPLEAVRLTLWKDNVPIDVSYTDAEGSGILNYTASGLETVRDHHKSFLVSSYYPIPFDRMVKIDLDVFEEQSVLAAVYDISGRVLTKIRFQVSPGRRALNLIMDNLPPGVYVLELSGLHREVIRLLKVGSGSGSGLIDLQLSDGWMGNEIQQLKSDAPWFKITAELDPYDMIDLHLNVDFPAHLEIKMVRNNLVEFITVVNQDVVNKTINLQKNAFNLSLTTPDIAFLKSGSYTVAAPRDETSSIYKSIDVWKDTTFIFEVDYSLDIPDPVNVSVNINDELVVSQDVDKSTGISLFNTDVYGNEYELIIPPGALFETTEISLRTINSIDGFPFSGGLVGGVDILPDGLQLFKPATLVIRLNDPNIIENMRGNDAEYLLTAFAYQGNGKDFHMYPYFIENGEIHLHIFHFSGYGTGGATQADQADQKSKPPGSEESRAQEEIADILNEEARNPDMTEEEYQENQNKIAEILRRWLLNEVMPLVTEAETNEDLMYCAVMEFYSWEMTAQLYEVLDRFMTERSQLMESIERGFVNALNRIFEKGVREKDPTQMGRYHLMLWMTMMWDPGFEISPWWDKYLKLHRFELEFESVIGESEGGWEISVKTERIVVELDDEQSIFLGKGPIHHVSGKMECAISFEGQSSILEIFYGLIDTPPVEISCNGRSFSSKGKHPKAKYDVVFYLDPGGTLTERFVIQCDPDDPIFPVGPAPIWFGSFGYIHEDLLTPELGFIITNWEMIFGELYARRIYTSSDHYLNETSIFTLWYAPKP